MPRYVEEQYNLQIGNAQNTQLARAIATGAEKGIFVLPKGGIIPLNVTYVYTDADCRRSCGEGQTPS